MHWKFQLLHDDDDDDDYDDDNDDDDNDYKLLFDMFELQKREALF